MIKSLLVTLLLMVSFPALLFLAREKNHLTYAPKRDHSEKGVIVDEHGAIIRGNVTRKEIALVLTGDEFGDGGTVIAKTLRKHKIPASFFLTGNFYSNPAFNQLIRELKKDGHYLGPHSDNHLLYADWTRRDSLLVTREEFKSDLEHNYRRMEAFGIKKTDAPYFLPPYEWYNSEITAWTKALDLELINFSPGTRSASDYTYPELGDRYVTSDAIYQSILACEKKDPHGLNGFILLIHIGTDGRRTDKFYNKLDSLLTDLQRLDYRFLKVTGLLK